MDVRADRFPHFDALRGIATLLVLSIHGVGFFGGGLGEASAIRPVLARFEVAVPIFLVISSFLLYRPFVRAHVRGERPLTTRAYAWRRFLRIVPAYWVALVLTTLALSTPGVLTPDGALTYFGFLQLYSEATVGGGIPQAWTLCLEVTFYALLPVLAWLLRRLVAPGRALRAHLLAVAGLGALGVAWKVVVLRAGAAGPVGLAPEPLLASLPGSLDVFAMGMALAIASVAFEDRPWPRALAWLGERPALAWAVALAALLTTAYGLGLDGAPGARLTDGQVVWRSLLFGVLATALVAPAVVPGRDRGVVRGVLRLRWLNFLGLVSYGTYLWHWCVLLLLRDWGLARLDAVHPYLLWSVVPFALAIALGTLSYLLVERPALSLKDLAGPSRAPGEAVAEPAPARALT